MKKILLPLFAIAFTACNNSDDASTNNPVVISGNFTLVNVSGSIAGVSNDFEPGVIKWHIDGENNSLAVINNFDDSNGTIEDFMETGSYTFETTTNETAGQCPYKYVAGENDLGCITQEEDGTIIFTQPYADGYVLTLQPE